MCVIILEVVVECSHLLIDFRELFSEFWQFLGIRLLEQNNARGSFGLSSLSFVTRIYLVLVCF